MFRTVISLLLAALPLLASARIERSAAEVLAFKRHTECPSTGLRRGKCPGFDVDLIRPLCMGGEDKVSNMQWISREDHRFKTMVDVRECRRLQRAAGKPAQ